MADPNVLLENDHLKVAKSTIEDAGFGLFARRKFKQGEIIAEYTGQMFSDYLQLTAQQQDDAFEIDDDHVIVADKKCFAAYANDARGALAFRKTSRNNSVFQRDETTFRVWIEALVDIDKDHEIFVSYGQPYWTNRM